ncbi:MAG: MerC domain-containing protein [Flavisolibacter sp.]|jgi:hypothetical protein|nr:MerC domain-containing protein [Flavisolibacter sp.]
MQYSAKADAISMGLSFVCLLHCIILPLFLTSIPFLGIEVLENKSLELLTILLSLLIGGYAIKRGYTRFHRNKYVVVLFAAGISLMMLSNFLIYSAEVWLKLSGGLVIFIAHIQNFNYSKKCSIK